MDIRRVFVSLAVFALPLTASATSVVVINAQNLASYNLVAAPLSGNVALQGNGIPGCSTNWTYSADTGTPFTYSDAAGSDEWDSASETSLAITLSGSSSGITFTACDGYDSGPAEYDQNLLALSDTFANIKAGIAPTQTCTKSSSCAPGGSPCDTVYGTQTGVTDVVVQVDDSNQIINWQTETVWGACN